MKKLFPLLLTSIFFFSCEKIEEPDILGRFSYLPENCNPTADPEYFCGSFIEFSEGGLADVLLGGDVISRTTYKIKGNKIKVNKSEGFGVELEFKYLNQDSIQELGNDTVWKKD